MKTPDLPEGKPSVAAKPAHFTPPDFSVSLKAELLNGRRVRALDYAPTSRPAFWGAILCLMDCLPIVQRWETIGERHLAGTRLRSRVFFIPADVRQGLLGSVPHGK